MNNPWREWKYSRLKAEWECQMESFLSRLTLELSLTPHFETAFRSSLRWTPEPLRRELEKTLQRVERGLSLEESLALFSQGAESPLITRVTSLLVHVIHEGITPESIQALQRVAEDLRNQEKTQLRAYSNQLTVYALVFIACSALVPAFFLSFVSIGSTFMEMSWRGEEIVFISWIVFPLVNAAILVLVWYKTPPSIRQSHLDQNDSGERKKSFLESLDFKCRENGIEGGLHRVLVSSTIEGCGLFLIGWSAYLHFSPEGVEPLLLLGAGALFPLLANVVFQEARFESITQKMENQWPDSLLMWASFPSTVSFSKALGEMSRTTHAPIREEWKKVWKRVHQGDHFSNAMKGFAQGRNGVLGLRASQLLVQGYVTGIPLSNACTRLAQDGMALHSLQSERNAALLIEKYTILGAGGLLVPLLLGLTTGMVTGLALGSGGEMIPNPIQDVTVMAVRGYLFIYAMIASLFAGMLNGSIRRAGAYAIWLIPLSQFLWEVGRAVSG
jgi:Flp pilus assembly protein TadB